ncbi:T9SS type A sorting domain-containing protein [Alkalitalea saponilacus]|uniref:Por secretion system C-terminal sorting domain-containing protein n=1 Tax=Alkalitalea saponilacus TaxID=889453 RepID=A0A1T5BVL4_9BACT|nr:T9SS type A sorting domain-containing protein [Alkalitalea saponilacus]ASB49578.1 hypothetical protein CDL62_10715 [Alkalitalea saponilacus]SKB51245.1 Por secretion system C-terminal sorting domain-containing protein [Alkalitalea saponilacus]
MKKIIKHIGLAVFLISSAITAQTRITYEYDRQGRVVTEEVENQYKVTFSYDVEGNLSHKHTQVYTYINEVLTEYWIQSSFFLHPNPVEDAFVIESVQGEMIKRVFITDINGRVCFKMNCNSNQAEVDIFSFLPGIYFVTIVSENKSEIFKVLKK